jgi:hypothetical protein
MRVFANRVLRGTFGPKREGVTGLRELRNERLHKLFSSQNITQAFKWFHCLKYFMSSLSLSVL